MNQSVSTSSNDFNYRLPCSFTGALVALAGVDGVEILVNGPSSCTGFAAAVIDGGHPLVPRNSALFSRLASQGLPRIPCSEITDADVILGIGNKLTQAIDQLAKKRHCECISVVNSCSLSLIGEDASNILKDHTLAHRILYLESTGCSKALSTGFSDALIALISMVSDQTAGRDDKTVNVLGLPINQFGWKHDARAIHGLMTLAGLKVNTILAARSTLREIRQIPNASLNVVINPDYGLAIARFMEDRFQMPYIAADRMPIGFDATRKLINDVLHLLNLPARSELDEEEQRCRKEAVLALSHSASSDSIRGLPVAVFGETAFVSGLSLFLKDYLGCYPVVLGIEGDDKSDLSGGESLSLNRENGIEVLVNPDQDQILTAMKEKEPAITFGSSFEEYLVSQLDYSPRFFVETTSPVLDRANLTYRPYLGFEGAFTFIEAILNCKITARYPYSEHAASVPF